MHPALLAGREDWAAIGELSTRITSNVGSVTRVVYSLTGNTSFPWRLIPATITRDPLALLRAVDHIVTEALFASGEYDTGGRCRWYYFLW